MKVGRTYTETCTILYHSHKVALYINGLTQHCSVTKALEIGIPQLHLAIDILHSHWETLQNYHDANTRSSFVTKSPFLGHPRYGVSLGSSKVWWTFCLCTTRFPWKWIYQGAKIWWDSLQWILHMWENKSSGLFSNQRLGPAPLHELHKGFVSIYHIGKTIIWLPHLYGGTYYTDKMA